MGRAEMDGKVLAESVKLVEKMASYESRPFDVLVSYSALSRRRGECLPPVNKNYDERFRLSPL